MDDGIAEVIAIDLERIGKEMSKQNELQDEANSLMRTMISALQSTAQELLELRQHLEKSRR